MVVYLGGDPVSVQRAEIGQTFSSEQDCIKRMKEMGIKIAIGSDAGDATTRIRCI